MICYVIKPSGENLFFLWFCLFLCLFLFILSLSYSVCVVSDIVSCITDMTKEEMSSPKCISRFKLQASFTS